VGQAIWQRCTLLDSTLFEELDSAVYTAAGTTDLYYVPDTVRPIYFLSDREDSQAEFSIPPNMAETSV